MWWYLLLFLLPPGDVAKTFLLELSSPRQVRDLEGKEIGSTISANVMPEPENPIPWYARIPVIGKVFVSIKVSAKKHAILALREHNP